MTAWKLECETTKAYALVRPAEVTSPLIVDSPHSWPHYPDNFKPSCSRGDLLTSWDAWVDELFGTAPEHGAPLLSACFPRFFIDPNRARDDIDPELVSGTLPFPLKPTHKSAKGFGLLRRNALPGVLVYDAPTPAEVLHCNIETYYDAYHAKLAQLIATTQQLIGRVVHLNCHSMKSVGNSMNDDPGKERPDVVVSDNFGLCADPEITRLLAEKFEREGLGTQINDPYKGGELICRHSAPSENRHSIQVELNRALYMNEVTFEKSEGFKNIRKIIDKVLEAFRSEI